MEFFCKSLISGIDLLNKDYYYYYYYIIIIIIRIQNGGRIAENATHINENSSTKLEFSYNLLIPLE